MWQSNRLLICRLKVRVLHESCFFHLRQILSKIYPDSHIEIQCFAARHYDTLLKAEKRP